MISARIPRMVLPQPKPRFAYMGGPARGRKVPTMLRIVVAAAMAEAE